MRLKKKPTTAEESIPNVILPHAKATNMKRMNVWVGGKFERTFQDVQHKRRSTWLLWAYAAVLVATQVLLSYSAQAGLALSAVTLVLLVAGTLLSEKLRKLTIGLAIIPLTQLVYGSFITHTAFQATAIVYGTILLLALVYRYLFLLDEATDPPKVRLSMYPLALLLVIVIGFLVGIVDYISLRYHYPYAGNSLPLVMLVVTIGAFAEVLLFQGLIQHQATKVTRPIYAAILSAILVFALTFDRTQLASVGPALLLAVVLPGLYYLRQNVLFCVVANVAMKLTYVALVATYILR